MNENYCNLIANVIRSGIFEKDVKYINSPVFENHCHLINIDINFTRKTALEIIELLDEIRALQIQYKYADKERKKEIRNRINKIRKSFERKRGKLNNDI